MSIFLTDPLIDSLRPKPPEEPDVPGYGGEDYPTPQPMATPDYGGQDYPSFPQAQVPQVRQLGTYMPEAAPSTYDYTPQPQPSFYQPGGAVGDVFSGLGSAFSGLGSSVYRGLAASGQRQLDAQESSGLTSEGFLTPRAQKEVDKQLEDADIPLWQKRAAQAAVSPLSIPFGPAAYAGAVVGGGLLGALEMTPLEESLKDAPLAVKVGVGILVAGATFAATKKPALALQQLESFVGPTAATALARGLPWAAGGVAGAVGTVAPYEAIKQVVGIGSMVLAQKAGAIVQELGAGVRFSRVKNPSYRVTGEPLELPSGGGAAAAAEPEFIDVFLDPRDGVYKSVKDFVPATERRAAAATGQIAAPAEQRALAAPARAEAAGAPRPSPERALAEAERRGETRVSAEGPPSYVPGQEYGSSEVAYQTGGAGGDAASAYARVERLAAERAAAQRTIDQIPDDLAQFGANVDISGSRQVERPGFALRRQALADVARIDAEIAAIPGHTDVLDILIAQASSAGGPAGAALRNNAKSARDALITARSQSIFDDLSGRTPPAAPAPAASPPGAVPPGGAALPPQGLDLRDTEGISGGTRLQRYQTALDDPTYRLDNLAGGAVSVDHPNYMPPAVGRVVKQATGNPDVEVTIWRAVPTDVPPGIEAGDWVALDRPYAQGHLDSVLNGKGRLESMKVPARDVTWAGTDDSEWVYAPSRPAAAAPAARPPVEVPPSAAGEVARPTLVERGLDKAKPKYGMRDVVFEDDIDKALYIVGNTTTKSKQHDRFMQFLRDATGGDDAGIMAAAKTRRAEIISMAKGSKTGDVIVRSSEPVAPEAAGGFGGGEPPVRPPAPPSEPSDAVPPGDDAVPPQPAAATATPEQIKQLTTFDFPETLTSQMGANPILESGVAKAVAALQREIVYRVGGEGAATKAAGKSSQARALFEAEARTAGLPADEALRIRSASLSGKYMLPGEPTGLTEAEINAVAEYVRSAALAKTKKDDPFLRLNIERAFTTLVLGVDRLQENQIEKLGLVFGSQFKAAARQASKARLPVSVPLSPEQQAIVNENAKGLARQIASLEQQAIAEREAVAELATRASNLPNVTPPEKAIKARVEERIQELIQDALKHENAAQKKAAAKQAKENPTIEEMLAQVKKKISADPKATPASIEAGKYFIRHELEYSASIPETTFPKAAAVRAMIVGTVADRYLDRLLDQGRVLADRYQLEGISERTAKQVADLYVQASLKKRYGDVVPKRITDEVARANKAANVIVNGLAALNQELKNVQFGVDIGVLGQQVNRLLTSEAPLQALVGLSAQLLIRAGRPMSFDSVVAGMTYAEKLLSYANSGLAINVSSGEVDLKAGAGLLNKIPGVGPGVEALTYLQYVVILQRLRVMTFESNLYLLQQAGEDITSPSVRATAAAFANAASSIGRPALLKTRSKAESALLLTPGMKRAQVVSFAQQIQVLDPRSSWAQRKLGIIGILNHWVINKAILAALAGVAGAAGTAIELDPSQKGYGNLTTRLKTAEGENIVVPIAAQSQVERLRHVVSENC